ncbi:hypothetical protein HPB48_000374 [Haemaphysalis longicornis]|uniref:Uncharacterized protein n=1 Tax=Haemaphysalis longicornis TaxID=44386 RepID=A0A9J6GIP1_HAELO|nr:hypothetical protein HPB48_000374 [Haemaphysalis longicornis]
MPRPKRSKSVWTTVFTPWDAEGAPGAGHTRTDTLFDSMFVFGHGRFQRLVLLFTKAALFVAFAHGFTVGTDLAPVDHWCRLPPPPDNVSHNQWKDYSIPRDPVTGKFRRCVRYGPRPSNSTGTPTDDAAAGTPTVEC